MDKQTKTNRTAHKKDRERQVAVWLILLLLFEILLVTVVLVRSLQSFAGNHTHQPAEEEPTGQPDDEEPAGISTAVFAGGVIPTMPQSNASTQTIGSGINSQYAILVDTDTGVILAQKDADTRFSPASLTKVMTLIVACENLTQEDLDRRVVLTQEVYDAARTGDYSGASVAGYDVGDEIRMEDLLYGIGVESAADSALMAVREIAGTEAAFVELMNRKVAEMGLTQTHFDNVIGYESEQNYTTAREMAMIMTYAMQSNLIVDILGAQQHVFQIGYYDESSTHQEYRFTYYSTFFRYRMETYQEYANKDFQLATAKLVAVKTGSFITSSYLACYATGTGGTKKYVLILGDAQKGTSTPASYATMCDLKTVLDTYVP